MSLTHVPPGLAADDRGDVNRAYSVSSSQGGKAFSALVPNTDCLNIGLGQFRCVDSDPAPESIRPEARAVLVTDGLPALRHHVSAIVSRRAKEQVARVDAGHVVAAVADVHSAWNWPVCKFPRNLVGPSGLAVDPEGGVAWAVLCTPASALPGPALIDASPVNLAPEPLLNGLKSSSHNSHFTTQHVGRAEKSTFEAVCQ